MTHQNLSLGMCWKLFWATLTYTLLRVKISQKSFRLTFRNSGMNINWCRPLFCILSKIVSKILKLVGIKKYWMNFFYTWPSIRLIHIERSTGVANKLKHFKAANFQRQLRKTLRLFSLMLFVVFIIIFFCLESPCYCTFLYIMNS